MMLRKWNSNFAPFTMQCPERYRRNLLRSFADWTGTRLPCVHSLNSVCHGQGLWHIFQVRCQPPCSGKFACLGSHPSLAHRTGATVEVVKARCQNCSSKLCLLFGPFEPRPLQQIRLQKNHNCGTVTSYHGLKWS